MHGPVASPSPWRRRVRRAAPWLLFAGALALWWVQSPDPHRLPTGEPAPALDIPWTGDGTFSLAEQRGHVTVLAFWATWCPACRHEGPTLSRVHRRIASDGDRVVGVSVDQATLPAVASTARRLGMIYPIALTDTATAQRFAVEMLPTIYVIGPRGHIRDSFTGAVSEETLMSAVEAARASDAS